MIKIAFFSCILVLASCLQKIVVSKDEDTKTFNKDSGFVASPAEFYVFQKSTKRCVGRHVKSTILEECSHSPNQIFQKLHAVGSYFILRAKDTNLCIVFSKQTSDRKKFSLEECAAENDQFFTSDEFELRKIPRSPKTYPRPVPKIIWTFWDKGEKALPAFNAYNVSHWRHLMGPLGYEVRIVDLVEGSPNHALTVLGGKELLPKNWDHLEELITTIKQNTPEVGVPPVVKSDMIRIALLSKFGGVWMDTSNVMVRSLEPIVLNPLNSNENFSLTGYVERTYASENSTRVHNIPVDGLENWFLAAKPNSELVEEWRRMFVKFWETHQGQSLFNHPMYKDQNIEVSRLSNPEYLNQHAALKYLLHEVPELGDEILPVDLKPWWLQERIGWTAHKLYLGIIGEKVNLETLAQEIKHEGVSMLKFASPHLFEIREHFKTVEDYCHRPNLLKELFGHCP